MSRLQVDLHNTVPMRLAAQFDCAPGELIALVGPSGSGKTSLLRAVAGLLQSASLGGSVRVGERVWFDSQQRINLSPQQRRAGLVFQSYALFPHLTAMENVAIGGVQSKAQPDVEADIRALFERLGLSGLAHRLPAQLSGGQQQRVALARALLRVATLSATPRLEAPGVLLLDEPFSAVDAPTRQTLYRELAALRQDVSTPMVLVTHDLAEARRLADRVVILDAGETLQSGPPAQVFASPRNARVAELVGIQNHFRGWFSKDQPGWGRLQWGAGEGGRLRQEAGAEAIGLSVIDKNKLGDGVAVTWVVAGELVDVLPLSVLADDALTARDPNLLVCRLTEMLALGETSLCTLVPENLPGERLTLNLATAQLRGLGATTGARLCVRIPAQGIHIMPLR